MCVRIRVRACIMSCMWRSEGILWALVFSFHYVGSRDGTPVFSPGSKYLYSPTRRRLKLPLMSKHTETVKSLATVKGFWTRTTANGLKIKCVKNLKCFWECLPMLHPVASLQPWLCPARPLPPHAVLIHGAWHALAQVVHFHVVMGCSTITMHTPFSVPVKGNDLIIESKDF